MIGRIFLNRYEAIRLLGEGGMGKVYLARQLDLGRQVVIKVMHDHISADPRFRERFQRETLLMANFQHPYAVTLYDASLHDPSGPCIVMEYVRGVNLETLLQRNGRLSPGRVGRLITQLGEVLQAAHDGGMIHRDLKPANLMVVDAETPREKIKVMDFGLAKLLDERVMKNVTESNFEFAIGTPGYICPEQVRGDEVDHRGDLYSVGVILFEMLTGRLPFIGPNSMDLMLAHATEPPPSFKELNLDQMLGPAIETVVKACLEKDPADRPQSARELIECYETALAIGEMGLPTEENLEDTQPMGPPILHDPNAMCFQMEAWMPESIAVVKLKGFVHDYDGEIVESIPGMIRVQLGVSRKRAVVSSFSWFRFGRRDSTLWMELHLHQIDPLRGNRLFIQPVFRPHYASQLNDPLWRERCTQAFVDLRAYLMGTSENP